ncbi:MAG: hypothetical protein ABR608_00890 [Pseudonocardiaceae bacterium]
MTSRITRMLDVLRACVNPRYPSGNNPADGTHYLVTPAELWNCPLPDPFPGAAPKPTRELLAWAATHAAFARAEAAGARAAVAELAKQFTTAVDDEELISRMQQAVRATMADIMHIDVPAQNRGKPAAD